MSASHQSRRPGDTADQSRRPGDTADQSRRPGDTADQSRRPGDTADQSRRPGDTADKSRRPGEMAEHSQASEHAVEIGQELRKAREALGLTVEDVCTAIKLHSSAVTQIENGQLEKLGPSVYARGFIKSYAKCVHMPSDWTVTTMAQLALDANPSLLPSRGHRPERGTGERGLQAASYLVGTAILVSGIFYVTQFDRLMAPESTPAIVEAPLTPTAAPIMITAPVSTTENLVNTQATSSAAVQTAPYSPVPGAPSVLSQTSVNPLPIPASQLLVSNEPAIAAGLGQLPSVSAPSEKLAIAVTGTVWVELTDATGRRLEYNNLSSGARKSYSGQAPYSLKLGNAPNATLSVSGTKIDLAPFTQGSVAKLQLKDVDGLLTPTR
jgi:cytoskeleton protein RodZ